MADQIRFLAGWMAVQAVPKLAEKVGLPLNLPAEHMIYGMSMDEIQKTLKDYEGVLKKLMNEHNLSWWDIYTNSDVGKERLALAEKMRIDEGDAVLDVGCWRGYFTIALATLCNTVCGLDLMNGFGRRDWWINFRAAMKVLGI